jgi:hypothetical protein
MKPRRLELADVFRAHQSDFLARWGHVLSPQQKKALRDIRDCRSAALGGRLQECEQCGHRLFLFNSCRNRIFLPVKVLSRFFRKRFLIHLRRAFQRGKLQFHGYLESLSHPAVFEALCFETGQTEWVVYAKPPFGGPDQVLKYLARYTHRVAISNRRLLAMADGRVTFEWKDYAAGGQSKTMTLEAVEFIRRFLLHVLPSGFVHIRHFGFLANRKRKEKLALCRALLSDRQIVIPARADSPRSPNPMPDERSFQLCPICKTGRLLLIQVLTAAACACLPVPLIADTS